MDKPPTIKVPEYRFVFYSLLKILLTLSENLCQSFLYLFVFIYNLFQLNRFFVLLIFQSWLSLHFIRKFQKLIIQIFPLPFS
jgi:hypothetical protein